MKHIYQEDELADNIHEKNVKFYSQKAIAIASYFGGPLAAGLLIRRNYINLGMEKEGRYTLIIDAFQEDSWLLCAIHLSLFFLG